MSTTTLCAFCESLPERSALHAAKIVRCPLCKTDLGVSPAGDKFRVVAVTPAVSHRGRNIAAAIGFAASMVLGAIVMMMAAGAQNPVANTPSKDIASPAPSAK